ncbi:MAG: hypothetical protein A2Y73_02500 [Chloroflexi bacterium RBG_13_56_8]|nr:MAG: hypothetical protein A2Y73_02500 [Chloroflexi bacterium RBG_13_56_8]
MGIIDTLTAGFNTVTKRLWLIVVPVMLDLFIWLGPKVSIAPVIEKMVATFRQSAEALGSTSGVDPGLAGLSEALIEELQGTIGGINLLGLLSWGRLGVPSLAGIEPINVEVDRVISISEPGQMVLMQVLIMAVGLFIACIFLGTLGHGVVREGSTDWIALSRKIPVYWLRLVAILIPLGVTLFVGVLGGFLLGPFGFFIWVLMLWAMLYLSFIPQAVVLTEDGPLAVVKRSFSVVRSNFWSSLGLVILINVISAGLSLVWPLLVVSPVGMLVAILANAYVGTGLTASMFVFFRDRSARQREALQQRSV